MYFKPNTLQALEAESGRGEGPTLNLSFHSSLVKHKLGLGWSTSFLVCETGVIPPTLWGFEEDCVSSRHQVDAHGLPESGVPATLICFLRVASLNLCSVSMSESLAHSHRGCSLSRVSEKCWGSCSLSLFCSQSIPCHSGRLWEVPHALVSVILQLQLLARKSFPSYFTLSLDLSGNWQPSS